jgi:hypothetical protein
MARLTSPCRTSTYSNDFERSLSSAHFLALP